MNNRFASGRCEYKYLLDPDTAAELRAVISERLEPDRNGGGKPYIISSVYFDSPAHKLWHQTYDREPYRVKLRLRVYGEGNDDSSVSFFEIKSKLLGRSEKQRLKLPLAQNERLWRDGILPENTNPLDARLARDIKRLIESENLAPAAIVSYDRLAYCLDDESHLRVTFDSKLRIRREDFDLRHGSYGEPIMGDECVLEVKSSTSVPLWISRLVSERGISNRSYSKYGKTNFNSVKGDLLCLTHSEA